MKHAGVAWRQATRTRSSAPPRETSLSFMVGSKERVEKACFSSRRGFDGRHRSAPLARRTGTPKQDRTSERSRRLSLAFSPRARARRRTCRTACRGRHVPACGACPSRHHPRAWNASRPSGNRATCKCTPRDAIPIEMQNRKTDPGSAMRWSLGSRAIELSAARPKWRRRSANGGLASFTVCGLIFVQMRATNNCDSHFTLHVRGRCAARAHSNSSRAHA